MSAGSSLTLELPSDCRWNQVPAVKVLNGDIVLAAGNIESGSDGRRINYLVSKASTRASDIELASGTIDIEANADPGSIVTKISNTGEVEVATIDTAVDVESGELPEVVPGKQAQQARSIVITENSPGAIAAHPNNQTGHIYLILADGVSFASLPEVTVDGSLKIDSGNIRLTSNSEDRSDNTLDIPILSSSTGSASKISISSLLITVDRTVPQGSVFAVLRGSAVDAVSSITAGNDPSLYTRNVATFEIAECVDQLSSPTVYQGSFTLGSNVCDCNGTSQQMDGSPYASNGRIFVPLKYLAQMLGIPNDAEHLVWDENSQSITINSPGGDTVMATAGSQLLKVNGNSVQMDVALEMVNGHVYLPARWLVEALGGTVEWKDSSQQVLVSISY